MGGEHARMTDDTKNIMDVILTIVGMIGAATVFFHTLREWQESQRWKRAEQLDKFVERFDHDEQLRLACVILDWSDRRITYKNRDLTLTNNDVLLALRIHTDIDADADCKFPGEQPTIRDAFDAVLAFFARLELALTFKLIDLEPAKRHFDYWLQRLLTMDQHSDPTRVLGEHSPEAMMRRYINKYGSEDSVERLRGYFQTGVVSRGRSRGRG